MTFNSISRFVFGFALLLAVAGCATMFSDHKQTLSVATDPSGARCTVMRNSGVVGRVDSTPGSFSISRGMHDIVASCDKNGYAPTKAYRETGFNKVSLWNLLNGFGFIIDFATGDLFEYDTTPIFVGMKAN
ncbi:MAG: hypothetical protein QM523_09315 [Candidatus Pacebacteria bacterium]|nr:hypothetical protein [Candidatus Paceibacterota bacterium]